MADDDSGDKTEEATPKKLRDARERGEVPKSRDVGLAASLLAGMVSLWFLLEEAPVRLAALSEASYAAMDEEFTDALAAVGVQAFDSMLVLSAIVLLPVPTFAIVVQFIQTGPVMTAEKFTPRLSHMNPVEGVKRMFGADNWVDLGKSLVYSVILLFIAWQVTQARLPDILQTSLEEPLTLVVVLFDCLGLIFVFGIAALALVTAADLAWQRHAFAKRMKMSQRDIRDEIRNTEGDPDVKRERRQLAEEWARAPATDAAGDASVLVVNPVHVAVAIRYDEIEAPVPVVTARGEHELARAMRAVAAEAEVPILRNARLARALLRHTDDGDMVPREFFDIVAEVTLWALRTRELLARSRRGEPLDPSWRDIPAPGEDLTRYPAGFEGRATGDPMS